MHVPNCYITLLLLVCSKCYNGSLTIAVYCIHFLNASLNVTLNEFWKSVNIRRNLVADFNIDQLVFFNDVGCIIISRRSCRATLRVTCNGEGIQKLGLFTRWLVGCHETHARHLIARYWPKTLAARPPPSLLTPFAPRYDVDPIHFLCSRSRARRKIHDMHCLPTGVIQVH